MKSLQKMVGLLLALTVLCATAGPAAAAGEDDVRKIILSSQQNGDSYIHTATLDGQAVPEYDYTWHADPSQEHQDVKNSPAEYYTGTEPTGQDAVYIAHDIVYYPELEQSKFQQVRYDGETEWVYLYEAEGYENYIFSTLPALKTGFPTQMMHSEEEAYQNAVLHITQAGTYEIEGQWYGQIWIDLGDEDDVSADPTQKVTLILNGVDVTCTVAPGVVFASVYECDNAWEDAESYNQNVDTSGAGATVVLADGTVNNVTGTNIFRILKPKYKDESSTEAYPAQKKAWKIDGAFYSYQSLNITGQTGGTGVLNITAGFEGLDTEHHLTFNGGHVNIYSQDDGINVNEDGVSVVTVNGGSLHICAGLGAEGDGIDSNGYLVINGGTVIATANPASDSGLDSDCGSFVNGGTVVALGSTMDWAESDSETNAAQSVLNLQFGNSQSADEAIVLTDTQGKVVFAYDPDQDEVTGSHQRTYQGAIVSAPSLTIGSSYHIYIGGNVEGSDVSGVYDIDTVTGFSGATLQCYSGNSVGGFGGGKWDNLPQGGMTPPDGANGEKPSMPEGMEQGGNLPSMPEGMGSGGATPPDGMGQGGQRPPEDLGEMGQLPSEGFDPGQMPGGSGNWGTVSGATCTYETVFTLSQQVSAFSSVSDYAHALTKVEAIAAQYGQNGTKEHYVCSGCGQLFADDAATVSLTAADVTIPSKDYTVFIVALLICAAALLIASVTAVVLVCRKRKNH